MFALWREDLLPPISGLEGELLGECHVVPEITTSRRLHTRDGAAWQLAAFATTTHFYPAIRQIWCDPSGEEACVVHGIVWREQAGKPHVYDAEALARVLARPGEVLPPDFCGEYAIVRLHSSGTVTAFSDPAGLHHIFYGRSPAAIVASRAGLIATITNEWEADTDTLRWLPAIGYRVGAGSSYQVARAVAQDQVLVMRAVPTLHARPTPLAAITERGGTPEEGARLLEEGLVQARAAILLGVDGSDRVALPITGGKDSRAVLALCLAAGLRDRLTLFTRGYEGHPDVLAGRAVAAACSLSHERLAPHGSDHAALWSASEFVDNLAAQTYQTDGMMGGWDFILGKQTGTDTLITGHMGEVLKAYAKRPMPTGRLDPIEMVKLQAPFDPLSLLMPEARSVMNRQLAEQMERAEREGALAGDQPDMFYYRNRIPNWLGGIRGIKSFERQPIMPLGVPALMRLAFRMTPRERQMEAAHHAIIRACAPALLNPPFALQTWHEGLREKCPELHIAPPILPSHGAPPVFGNWQYSINHVPAIREFLASVIASQRLSIWESVDRDILKNVLAQKTLDYFGGISLLGLVAAAFQEIGIVRPVKLRHGAARVPPIQLRPLARKDPSAEWDGEVLSATTSMRGRPVAPFMMNRLNSVDAGYSVPAPALQGHVDIVSGPVVAISPGRWQFEGEGKLILQGWLHARDYPGARPSVELRANGTLLAQGIADRPRADLGALGLGDGAYGFNLSVDSQHLRAEAAGRSEIDVLVTTTALDFTPVGGRLKLLL